MGGGEVNSTTTQSNRIASKGYKVHSNKHVRTVRFFFFFFSSSTTFYHMQQHSGHKVFARRDRAWADRSPSGGHSTAPRPSRGSLPVGGRSNRHTGRTRRPSPPNACPAGLGGGRSPCLSSSHARGEGQTWKGRTPKGTGRTGPMRTPSQSGTFRKTNARNTLLLLLPSRRPEKARKPARSACRSRGRMPARRTARCCTGRSRGHGSSDVPGGTRSPCSPDGRSYACGCGVPLS